MKRRISFMFMIGVSAEVELKTDTSFQLKPRPTIRFPLSTPE